jgi:hypothetical protein
MLLSVNSSFMPLRGSLVDSDEQLLTKIRISAIPGSHMYGHFTGFGLHYGETALGLYSYFRKGLADV